MTEEIRTVDDDYLDKQVYLNTRTTVRTRIKLDRYLDYMDTPAKDRPENTHDWPTTIVEVVEQALNEWLAKHPRNTRPGPKKPDPLTKSVLKKARRNDPNPEGEE